LYSVKNAENPRVSLLYTHTHARNVTRFRLITLLIFIPIRIDILLLFFFFHYYHYYYFNNIVIAVRRDDAAEAVSHARTGAALPHVRFVVVVTSVVTRRRRRIRAPPNPPPTARRERLIAAAPTPTPPPPYTAHHPDTRRRRDISNAAHPPHAHPAPQQWTILRSRCSSRTAPITRWARFGCLDGDTTTAAADGVYRRRARVRF